MPHFRRLRLRSLGLLLAAGALTSPISAQATDPVLRHQQDLHGDVVVFGSTLGFDCGAGLPAPAGATASCTGQLNTADGAPDLWWRDNIADASITATQARTSATLTLPAGATITYARLYWAALKVGQNPDIDATLDWLGGPQQQIVADTTWVSTYGPAHPDWYYYQASGDATDFVATWGAGDFRVSDVEALDIVGVDVDRVFSAWTLVVFYENAGDELRNLALFDSFTPLDPAVAGQGSASVTLSGFLVPSGGFTARMSAFAYEGDTIYTGDHFTLNGTQIQNGPNPADNFFNSSRTYNGTPVSGTYDVPKLTGAPGSMAGYDLDTADVTSMLKPKDTSCVVGADTTKDIFFLGGFITSVMSLAPDFHGMTKDVVDLNGGALLPGDTLQYTITATNSGNDASVDTVFTDVLESGISLVPGSIEILQGAGAATGLKTDGSGDDEGDYDSGTRTVTWRVGAGANATSGGMVEVGETIQVRFKAKVTKQSGDVANQALLTAAGDAGAPDKTWYSDGDPQSVGDQPTKITVYECDSDAQCSGNKPHCDPTTHTCVGCQSDADCPDPNKPACQPNGSCGECSATNGSKCMGNTPACDTMSGNCVLCTLGPQGDAAQCQNDPDGPVCVSGMGGTVHCGCTMDSDCGGPMSGKVCDSVPSICVDGCRGMGGNGCPTGEVCSSKDTTIGTCGPDTSGMGGGGTGGSGTGGESAGDQSRCGCEVPGGSQSGHGMAALAAMMGLAALARRRRK
jgi:uncharacterized repeat protein (TIGR01451 family)/MYXO-CTERM domain-containing protein